MAETFVTWAAAGDEIWAGSVPTGAPDPAQIQVQETRYHQRRRGARVLSRLGLVD